MRKVPLEEAVGLPLGHDVTEISLERKFKGRAFRRGHVIRPEDLSRLRDLGKNSVFVLEEADSEVHEDDAAIVAAPLLAGQNIDFDPEPCEGKISFRAACDGVFRVDPERLLSINSLEIPALPTLRDGSPVTCGRTVATYRIIPLTCSAVVVEAVTAALDTPLLHVRPYVVKTAGIVVTGREVFDGRVQDAFIPRLTASLGGYGVRVESAEILPDEREQIAGAVDRAADRCDIVFVTGGTSVDPDDVTVLALADAGVDCRMKGMPVQPGNNFTIGYRENIPVCAVPAATIFYDVTAFDVFLPRLLAGERISVREIHAAGHGGLLTNDQSARS